MKPHDAKSAASYCDEAFELVPIADNPGVTASLENMYGTVPAASHGTRTRWYRAARLSRVELVR